MYRERKPRFPKLHKCGWCRRRLDKSMPIIAKEIFWGDGMSVECYFCDEKCARAEVLYKKEKEVAIDRLNNRIEKGED